MFLNAISFLLYLCKTLLMCIIIISPNEVFGDIMVLASRPPLDPEDVNTLAQQIFNLSLSNFI